MPVTGSPDQLGRILKDAIVALSPCDGLNLSACQLRLFLKVNLDEGPHAVRRLAAFLDVSKAAITRGVDRFEELGPARRKPDPRDHRSGLIQRTVKGAATLRETRTIVGEAAASEQSVEVSIAPQHASGS